MCYNGSAAISQCLNAGRCDVTGVCICKNACFAGNFCEINHNAALLPLVTAIAQDLTETQSFYIVLFLMFGILGLISNILSLATFLNSRIRITVCGIYLIFFSIFGIILSCTILTYLITITRYKNFTYQLISCYGIPYLSVLLNDGAIFFTTAIAVERTFIECWNLSLHGTRKRGLLICITISIFVASSNIDEIFLRGLSVDPTGDHVCIYEFDGRPMWHQWDTIFSYIHIIIPCLLHLVCSLCTLTTIARRKTIIHSIQRGFLSLWFKQWYHHRDFFFPPLCIIVCLLPHGLLGHLLNTCIPYSDKALLRVHIAFVLLLFVPQIFSFILYVYPNRNYWKEFQHTTIYRTICCCFYNRQQQLRINILMSCHKKQLIGPALDVNEVSDTNEQFNTRF